MAKQVIVVRRDLNMPIGKACAQSAHSAMGTFFNIMKSNVKDLGDNVVYSLTVSKNSAMYNYIEGAFTKAVVYVDSLEDLLDIQRKCDEKKLLNCLITDKGLTVFDGKPTVTCLSVGPLNDDEFDGITSHLKLYVDGKDEKIRSYEKLLRRIKQEKNFDNIKKIIVEYETKRGVVI